MAYVFRTDNSNATVTLRDAGTSVNLTGIAAMSTTALEVGELRVGGGTVWSTTLDPSAPAACHNFPKDEPIPVPAGQAVTWAKKTAGARHDVTLFFEG